MIGRTLSHYRITEKIGEGGMGVVYRAEDTRLGRTVALKVMAAALADETAKRRFVQEAQAASSLEHPNVCVIHEIDETPEGQTFIVMPCYEGESLEAKIARGPMGVSEAVSVGTQVASGLAKAHEKGIVHRDIKPGNILVTDDGVVKIVDFGLAKLSGSTKLTRTGTTPGTVAYMAPEQLQGLEVDARADIWALGVVLYEMLAGRLPFHGDYEQAMMYSIVNSQPAPLSQARADVPAALVAIVDRALSKDRSGRFATADDMVEALGSVTGGQRQTESDARRRLPSIAVLPFANMSPDRENQYFGDGLTEELINALAQIEGLRVAARTSAFRFRGEGVDLHDVGEKLNVSTVLEGSVRKAGNRLRITAQLINIDDGYHLWSKRFDREMADIFDIQDEIARAIVEQLKVTLVGAPDRALVTAGTSNLDAYTAMLEGRYHLHSLTPEGWERSLELLETAIVLDPSFAQPHAWLSDYYQSLAWWGTSRPHDVMPKSRAAAERAIALDDGVGLAHANLGVVLYFYDWDVPAARREFERAVELDKTSGNLRVFRALFLSCVGEHEGVAREARTALKLEPLDGLLAAWAASALVGAGAVDEAIDVIERAMRLDQEHWQLQLFLGFAHLHASRPDEAVAALERAVKLSGRASITISALGVARCMDRDAAPGAASSDGLWQQLVDRSQQVYVAPALLAHLARARGDHPTSLHHLKRAIEEHDPFLRTKSMWPRCARLEGPEVEALLKRAGLE